MALTFLIALAFLLFMSGMLVVVVLRVTRLMAIPALSLLRVVLSLPPVRHFVASHPKAFSLLRARFSPAESLGIHLTLGFVASLLFAWVFAEIADDIRHAGVIFLDETIVVIMSYLRTQPATDLFVTMTFLGSWYFVSTCSLLVVLVFSVARRPAPLVGYVAVIGGGGILNQFLKAVYMRSRPLPNEAIAEAAGWSFPSGHAMMSVVFYGMLLYLLFVFSRSYRLRAAGSAVAFVLVFLIGLSRIYLGVHYPTDVIAGYVAGLFWLAASLAAIETFRKRTSLFNFSRYSYSKTGRKPGLPGQG